MFISVYFKEQNESRSWLEGAGEQAVQAEVHLPRQCAA
jgi:hypothetical protein